MNSILVEKNGAIATITLSRPDHGNAICMELARDLAEAAKDCADDDSVRCVILTGAGRMFCVGGDVGAFAGAGSEAGRFLREIADQLHVGVATLATMRKPLVTAVNGPAAGAGMSLAMLGDFAFASSTAHFTAAYTAIGLTPDGGMSWMLPRLVGVRRSQEMILTNMRVSASEAEAVGLVTRAVAPDALMSDAIAMAQGLATSAVGALGAARGLLLGGSTRSLVDHLDEEARTISAAASGAEAKEGIAAFLDRRKPDFPRF